MTERQALLAATIANPADDTVRLVFADWCQENGEEPRAHYIRQSIGPDVLPLRPGKLHIFGEGEPAVLHFCPFSGRWQVDKIEGNTPYRTTDELTMANRQPGLSWTMRRGFADGVTCDSRMWARLGDNLVATQPIQTVTLTTPVEGRWDIEAADTLGDNPRFFYSGCPRVVTEKQVKEQRERDGEDFSKLNSIEAIHAVENILRALWPSIPLSGWTVPRADTPRRESTHERGERLYGSPRSG